MWLLFYVMDYLSLKLLQEGKQAIQRQPFLHNANLSTSIPTDNHPSVSHKEFENIYNKMPQSPTGIPTASSPSVSHREFENIYNKMPQSPTGIPTASSPSVSHREFENIYNKMPQSPTDSPTDFSTLIPTEYVRR